MVEVKTLETLKPPWSVIENISYALLWTGVGIGVGHLLFGGHIRPWVWAIAVVGAMVWTAMQAFRWRAVRDDVLRRKYMHTVEYLPLFVWLRALGLVAIFALWYLLATN